MSVRSVVERLKRDPFAFFDMYARCVAKQKAMFWPLGALHSTMLEFLEEGPKYGQRKLLLVPRAHLKTTLLRSWILWRLWNDPNETWTIVSQKGVLSTEGVSEIKSVLERVPFLRHLRGPKWQADSFIVRRKMRSATPSVTCSSMTTSATGTHPGNILFDDPINFENVNTPANRDNCLSWLNDAESLATKHGNIYIIGTRWHRQDLYAEAMHRGFNKLILPAIISDPETGEEIPLWPEAYSLDQLYEMRQTMGPVFDMQYMLDPSPVAYRLFQTVHYTEIAAVPPGARLVCVDFAYPKRPELRRPGEPTNCAIAAVVVVYGDGYVVPVDGFIRADIDINEAIDRVTALGMQYQCPVAGERIAEARAFRREPNDWILLHPKGREKGARIAYLASEWNAGKVRLLENEIGVTLAQQAQDYPSGLIDGLDALAYAVLDGRDYTWEDDFGRQDIESSVARLSENLNRVNYNITRRF